MSRTGRVRSPLHPLLGAVFIVSAMHGSCYRAEVDLSSLREDGGPGGRGGESSSETGSGGAPIWEAGTGGADSGSGAGAGGEAGCVDSPLDENQIGCEKTGALPRAYCSVQDIEGWSGCYNGGCAVCVEGVADYPHYFTWYPCCGQNFECNSNLRHATKCDARCPAPTERDKLPPCSARDVTR